MEPILQITIVIILALVWKHFIGTNNRNLLDFFDLLSGILLVIGGSIWGIEGMILATNTDYNWNKIFKFIISSIPALVISIWWIKYK